jgi:hypothetical protein
MVAFQQDPQLCSSQSSLLLSTALLLLLRQMLHDGTDY